MGKFKRKPTSAAPAAVPGIGVPVSKDAFVGLCAAGLKELLSAATVYPVSAETKLGEVWYLSVDPTETARGTKQDAMAVRVFAVPGVGDRFWMAVNVRFQYVVEACFLEHVSIRIYTGRRGDDGKRLRIRAEWDLRTQEGGAAHAQPHWHVHSVDDMLVDVGTTVAESRVQDLQAFLEMGKEFMDTSLADILTGKEAVSVRDNANEDRRQEKLHLAMVSGWHLEADPGCVNSTDEQGVRRWIFGVVTYVISQLQYLASKMGHTLDDE